MHPSQSKLAFLGVKNEMKPLKWSDFYLRLLVELQVGDCDVMQAACNKYKGTFPIIFSLKLFSCVTTKCKAAHITHRHLNKKPVSWKVMKFSGS